MKRVLQLVTRDEPGGVQVLTRAVGAGLAARGYQVDTLALCAAPMHVVRVLIGGCYDAVLSYQVAAGLAGSLLASIARVPIRAVHLTAVPSAMRQVWRVLDRLWGIVGLHTAIVANCAATATTVSDYPARYRRRVTLIRHGVPQLPPPDRVDWRARLGLPAGARLLAASGRLVAQKDHATAVAAIVALPDVHLAIAGDGPLRQALLQQAQAAGISGRLHLLGNCDAGALASLLACSDVYMFPSVWESFGLAGVEAAMLGLPIVAADLAVLREVLAVPARLGMLHFHAPGDAADCAAKLAALLARKPCPHLRRISAAQTVAEHSVEAMIKAYCRLLDN